MGGLLGAAFGFGQSIAGLGAPKMAAEVTAAANSFDDRVAADVAKETARATRYQLGAQRVQIGASGGAFGSLLFAAADDARKARSQVTKVYLQSERNKQARIAGNPSQADANANALGSLGNLGASLFNAGIL